MFLGPERLLVNNNHRDFKALREINTLGEEIQDESILTEAMRD